MRHPRILVLSQTLPHPPDSGVKSRTANLLRQLSREFEVSALCFYREATLPPGGVREACDGLREVGAIEAFPIPQEQGRLRLVRDHAESIVTGRVYTVPAYRSEAFGERLASHLATGAFDLVHADSLDLSGWFDQVGELPLVCGHHDIQSLLLARRAKHDGSWVRRRYLAHQSRRMLAEERRWCGRVALNTCVSELDRRSLEDIAPTGKFMVVPNGMDLRHYEPGTAEGEGLLFIGSASWSPNRDAMRFYAEEIQPHLVNRPGAALTWVGAVDTHDRADLAGRGITFAGHVADTRPFLRKAACCVAPIRMGSGTRIKILEAWAMGKAVVATSIGCEGLRATDGENILIRDDPAAFAAATIAVLTDHELRARLGARGRATVEAHYDWDRIGTLMNAAYLNLVTT